MKLVTYLPVTISVAAILLLLVLPGHASADSFGSGDNSFEIDFVTIGDPGNAADTTGNPNPAGSVDYVYRIGKYEISRDMVIKASTEGDLDLSSTLNSLDWVTGGPRPDMPAAGVSWNEAARFTNWLNTSEGFSPAYKFGSQPGDEGYRRNDNILLWQAGDPGFDAANPFRNSQAQYVLPSLHEWYKAAYYDPNANDGTGGYWNYPTGSDSAPTPVKSGTDPGTAVYGQSRAQGPADITQAGGLSPYGVMGLAGNVFEHVETEFDLVNDCPSCGRDRMSSNWFATANYFSTSFRPFSEGAAPGWAGGNDIKGLRVASTRIPEPSMLDFNNDFNVNVLDVDSLVGEIVAGKHGGLFDLTGEGIVDDADLNQWLSDAAAHNGFDQEYLAGDSNLDGKVDSIDLNNLALNWRRDDIARWSAGDFTANGRVGSDDLNELALNWRQSIPMASPVSAPVPEPSALLLTVVGLALAWRRRIR